jgi:hypothetical protein
MADWAKIPASSLGFSSTNKSLLAVLETDSQLLESGQARFWSMVRDVREGGRPLEVTCFFEELPLPAVGHVVPKESATLEGYAVVSVHADHRNMVRFGWADDNGFKRVVCRVDQVARTGFTFVFFLPFLDILSGKTTKPSSREPSVRG